MKVWQSFVLQVIASKHSLHSERRWDKRVPPAQLSVFFNSYLFSLVVLKASPVANVLYVHTVAMWTLLHLANWRISAHLQFRLLTILYPLSLNSVSLLLSTVSPWASKVLHLAVPVQHPHFFLSYVSHFYPCSLFWISQLCTSTHYFFLAMFKSFCHSKRLPTLMNKASYIFLLSF